MRREVVPRHDLFIPTHEHAISDKESAIYKHLRTCEHLIFIQNLCNLPDTLNTNNGILNNGGLVKPVTVKHP